MTDDPSTRWERPDLLFAAAAWVVSLAIQGSFVELIGSDGFFHVRAAERVLGGGMPWMPYSVFSDGWVDHQLGFHLAMAPFAWTLPGLLAAKLAAATFAAVAAVAMFRLLRQQGAPAPWLFAALPFGLSWMFLLRMEMPRTQSLSLALLVAVLASLASGRHRWTFALAWAYAWTYHVSLVVLPVAALFGVVVTVMRRAEIAAAGLVTGFVVHPHTPRTLRFVWQHVFQKVANEDALPVGLEWTDGSAAWFVGGADALVAGPAGCALLAAAGLLVMTRKRPEPLTLVVLLLAGGATAAVAVSGTKFVEYSTPLSTLGLALALRDSELRTTWLDDRRWQAAVAIVLGLLLFGTGASLAGKVAASEPHPDELAGAAAYLAEHVPDGETVFHFHWNDFPELVFHAPQYRYIVGLDPHFLYLHDADRWRLYEAMGGAYSGRRSDAIADTFGARWAVLRLPHPGAREALAADPGLRKVFDDGAFAVIYEVRPAR